MKSKLALSLVAMIAVLGLAACGEPEEDPGTVKTDAGGLPPPPDGGNTTTTDGGSTQTGTDTTVPAINKKEVTSPSKVTFKAIAVSPIMQISKKSSDADPAKRYCEFGMFVADETAAPENNGVMLFSKGTVTADLKCAKDSVLHAVTVGAEVQVNGYYQEDCSWNGTACDKDGSADIAIPQVSVNRAEDVTLTGRTPGVPASLPVLVTIDEINSTPVAGSAGVFTLGSKWWSYRTVLVKVENVVATDVTPGYCEWDIAPQGATTPVVRVDDGINFAGTTCPHRPATGTEYSSLAGHLYFYKGGKILPRTISDASPALPGTN